MNPSFSEIALNEIFKFNPEKPNRLISRECSWLEFKESFNYGSFDKYVKTMAAFANNKGGYLVFGVKDKPKDLIGLNDNTFDNLEPTRLSNILNSTFSPEINWNCSIKRINNLKIGLIYVYESSEKPVIAKTNNKDIKEGSIYYRYHGSSENIKYSELISLLNSEKEKEKRQWLKLFTKINKAGISNIGLLDLKTGEISETNGTYYINEDLIKEINFIKEGKFTEIDGDPALKLIGKVKPINVITSSKEIFHKSISSLDLITTFLAQNNRLVAN